MSSSEQPEPHTAVQGTESSLTHMGSRVVDTFGTGIRTLSQSDRRPQDIQMFTRRGLFRLHGGCLLKQIISKPNSTLSSRGLGPRKPTVICSSTHVPHLPHHGYARTSAQNAGPSCLLREAGMSHLPEVPNARGHLCPKEPPPRIYPTTLAGEPLP